MLLHAQGPEGGRFRTLNRLLHTDRLAPLLIAFNLLVMLWALCAQPAAAATPVEVAPLVASAQYEVRRSYGGEVRANRASTLGFRSAGIVHAVRVDEGERVAAGTVLAELDPEPLQAQLEQARATLDHALASADAAAAAAELGRDTLRRYRDLVDRGHTSVQQFDEVRLDLAGREAGVRVAAAAVAQARAGVHAAEVELDRSRLVAPYDARIQTRMVDEGSIVVPGQTALRLLETGPLEARIGLPTDVAEDLAPGARFRLRAGRRAIEGTLLHVLPEVDPQTRTVTALFALDASDLAVGRLIELTVERTVRAPGFWVPISALTEAQRGLWSLYVLTPTDGGFLAERRLVEVLHTDADRVYVRGTLRNGERVVRTGTQRIVPGQVVTPVTVDAMATR